MGNKDLSGKDFYYSIWNKHPEWTEEEQPSGETIVMFSYKADPSSEDIEPLFLIDDHGFDKSMECVFETPLSVDETEKFLEEQGFTYHSDCDWQP